MSIEITSKGDLMGPLGTKMDFFRALFDSSTGTPGNPRAFRNEITSVIDGSVIYGSDRKRADALRTFKNGKLKTGRPQTIDKQRDYKTQTMPLNAMGLKNEEAENNSELLFLAGDIRVNEQMALVALHTLFLREHNRLCDLILKKYPDANDSDIYHLARKIVGMEIQRITFEEFLPALLGPLASRFRNYRGHDRQLHAGLSLEFSGAGFRFGHSLLSSHIRFTNGQGKTLRVPLKRAFFDQQRIRKGPRRVDNIFRGLIKQKAQELDVFIVNDVRNALFGKPGKGGMDLGSLNIQRGRDFGLPFYNEARKAYGLRPKKTFSQVTSDGDLAGKLRRLYGSPDEMDLWVGALAEKHVAGASVGELLGAILVEQFDR